MYIFYLESSSDTTNLFLIPWLLFKHVIPYFFVLGFLLSLFVVFFCVCVCSCRHPGKFPCVITFLFFSSLIYPTIIKNSKLITFGLFHEIILYTLVVTAYKIQIWILLQITFIYLQITKKNSLTKSYLHSSYWNMVINR